MTDEELDTVQKLSYHAQYALSSAGLQVSWTHLSTLVLPQSWDSDEMPAFAKHAVQQDGVGVADGTVLELTAPHEELLDGYGTALEETGATGTLELELVTHKGEQLLVVVVWTVQELEVTVFVAHEELVHGTDEQEELVHG
jgi:hypothetical protein